MLTTRRTKPSILAHEPKGPSSDRKVNRPLLSRKVLIGAALGLTILIALASITSLQKAGPTLDRRDLWIDEVRRGPLELTVQGRGTLQPDSMLWVSATSSGRVARLLMEPGTRVAPGSVVLELEAPELELDVLEAENALATAQAEVSSISFQLENERLAQESLVTSLESQLGNLERRARADRQLAGEGYLARLELEQSEGDVVELTKRIAFERRRLESLTRSIKARLSGEGARIEALEAEAALKRRQLEALEVRAGAHGVLQELSVEVGQQVDEGTVLAKVADPAHLKAELEIPEILVSDVKVGQTAVIDMFRTKLEGRVSRIDPAVREGRVHVDVAFDGELPAAARSDLAVVGTIELAHLEDALFLGRSTEARSNSPMELFQLAPDGESAVRTHLEVGQVSAEHAQILSGLEEGDRVILSDMSEYLEEERIVIR